MIQDRKRFFILKEKKKTESPNDLIGFVPIFPFPFFVESSCLLAPIHLVQGTQGHHDANYAFLPCKDLF